MNKLVEQNIKNLSSTHQPTQMLKIKKKELEELDLRMAKLLEEVDFS